MIGNYDDLKTALTDSGNPFVWVTAEGWAFNEQKDAFKFSAGIALACNSFDELMEKMEASSEQTQAIPEPAPKGRNKKK